MACARKVITGVCHIFHSSWEDWATVELMEKILSEYSFSTVIHRDIKPENLREAIKGVACKEEKREAIIYAFTASVFGGIRAEFLGATFKRALKLAETHEDSSVLKMFLYELPEGVDCGNLVHSKSCNVPGLMLEGSHPLLETFVCDLGSKSPVNAGELFFGVKCKLNKPPSTFCSAKVDGVKTDYVFVRK